MIDDALTRSAVPLPAPAPYAGRMELLLSRFALADRSAIRCVYGAAASLALLWRSMGAAVDWETVGRGAAALARAGLVQEVERLGQATRQSGLGGPDFRNAVHDIRSGLSELIGGAELLAIRGSNEELARICAMAARDLARLMRRLLPDLDPQADAADDADG
jgi:signal transduction histidine kinase